MENYEIEEQEVVIRIVIYDEACIRPVKPEPVRKPEKKVTFASKTKIIQKTKSKTKTKPKQKTEQKPEPKTKPKKGKKKSKPKTEENPEEKIKKTKPKTKKKLKKDEQNLTTAAGRGKDQKKITKK